MKISKSEKRKANFIPIVIDIKFVGNLLILLSDYSQGKGDVAAEIRGKEESWQLVVDDLPERSLLRRLAVKPYADSSTPMARP